MRAHQAIKKTHAQQRGGGGGGGAFCSDMMMWLIRAGAHWNWRGTHRKTYTQHCTRTLHFTRSGFSANIYLFCLIKPKNMTLKAEHKQTARAGTTTTLLADALVRDVMRCLHVVRERCGEENCRWICQCSQSSGGSVLPPSDQPLMTFRRIQSNSISMCWEV